MLMTSRLFNRAAPLAPQETPLPPALAAIFNHPIMFVTGVWLVAYVAIAPASVNPDFEAFELGVE
jgi:hypothetical protein